MFRKFLILFVLFLLVCPVYARDNKWGNTKPPVGSQIDWGHPLSQGLVGCWLINERSKRLTNIVNNQLSVSTGAYTSVIIEGLKAVSGGATLVNLGTYGTKLPSRISFVISFTTSNITADFPRYLFNKKNGGSFNDFSFYKESSTGNDMSYSYFAGAATHVWKATDFDMVANQWYQGAVTCIEGVTTGVEIYKNGRLCSITDSATSAGYYSNTSQVGLFEDNGGGGDDRYTWRGNVRYLYYWHNRILTPSEIQQLYVEPYCFIKKSSWLKAGAAAVRRMFIVD